MRYSVIFLLLLFAACSFSDFGNSQVVIQRVWTIDPANESTTISFDGMLAYNDSYHEVINAGVSDNAMLVEKNDSIVHVVSNITSNQTITISANATVNILYETDLLDDPSFKSKYLGFTELTEPNEQIVGKAKELKGKTALTTIRNLTNWVNSNMRYDLNARSDQDAKEIFENRRGVCIEYSHLFISMARSLGLDTRYVAGYVKVNDKWQSHAWAQVKVPDQGWIHVDPTFAEIGELSSSHLIIGFGDDRNSIYDKVSSDVWDVDFSVDDSLELAFSSTDPRGLNTEIEFENGRFTVINTNNRPEFVFGSYSFQLPPGYGGYMNQMILLNPKEERHYHYDINTSGFREGFSYNIPARSGLNDAVDEINAQVMHPFDEEAPLCPFALLLLSFIFLRIGFND